MTTEDEGVQESIRDVTVEFGAVGALKENSCISSSSPLQGTTRGAMDLPVRGRVDAEELRDRVSGKSHLNFASS
ncbi:unnamed protein product [Hymenolepis diminuta]|uniref:Uncharacterized protein n=1 Tax=Hymenolepis diminuta TaxID=6216 RepID=A0A3P6ZKK9_HYMDI|nr:unnamed protein product [Hymenolepis diminuta]